MVKTVGVVDQVCEASYQQLLDGFLRVEVV